MRTKSLKILTIVNGLLIMIALMLIIFREGLEAALIVATIVSYLVRTGRYSLLPAVVSSVVTAALVSIGFGALLALSWASIDPEVLPVFEGLLMIFAAILLTTMLVWMARRGSQMRQEIETSVEQQTMTGSRIGIFSLGFVLILREGVEMALFTMAFSTEGLSSSVIAVTAGILLAALIGFAVVRGSIRLSPSSMLKWSSIMLIFIAAGMFSYGIHELQEAGLLLIGPLEVWNLNPPLMDDGTFPLLHENGLVGGILKGLFGYNGNPSALEVVAYSLYLLFTIVLFIRNRSSRTLSAA